MSVSMSALSEIHDNDCKYNYFIAWMWSEVKIFANMFAWSSCQCIRLVSCEKDA